MRGDRLAVIGTSRGGELALLLGATFPQLTAVVSYVGSGAVFGFPLDPTQPAWTYRGAPVPFATRYGELDDPATRERVTIPVERTNGPVLLISGEDDRVWPSAALSEIAAERLARAGRPYPDRHLRYPGAGHGIRPPHQPTAGQRFGDVAFGGTGAGVAFANADSWSHILALLDGRLQR